ncbi:hypothetical protein MNBD_BACTEROID07-1512 [hydrothermal vent metagenome]|uniref:Molybdopterin-guanine dinucleotide biosynthesis protein B (MobB) domain-containing protein n=1 Tax=hydrothermal vent metagenome TaxID=652676 RepID=A0A3B0VCX4_9ZZZZ
MIFSPNWIIVGGTGRNIGKTTLVEKLVGKFGSRVPLTAIKISNIKPESRSFHGHNVEQFSEKILLQKELRTDGNKDSMRLLKAGAETSWFIQTEDVFLPETFPEIQAVLKESQWVVCESNSLRRLVKPGLFIMVEGKNNTSAKKDIPGLLQLADVVVEALQWEQFDMLVERIEIREGRFILLR